MGNWSEELHNKIDEQLQGGRDKDLRFFRIDEFKRNIGRVDEFSGNCPECQKARIDITEAVETIAQAVNHVGKQRRDYDRLITRLSKHMQKEHGFYAPYYFTYLISFFGIIGGSVLGYLLMQLNADIKLELFLIGFSIGLLPTYIWGHLKDKKLRKEKRLM
ncbi:SoxR reducing system RseC family protein [uncultured Draconibacterium sp.]|uniref:SoxR reducing system RseC family protein n=1 Tax=uncultured Draconibacterium sp. TaxID=1573823 RepID=UPI0029C87B89|nr:SoxR reducing system RseC family protein [uncultured Draconibacterium sp.]